MEDKHTNEILAELISSEEGLTQTSLDEIRREISLKASLYSGIGIKILSVTGGLLAVVSFMAFLFSTEILQSGFVMIFLGVFMITASLALNKAVKNLTFDTVVISANITGYILLGMGISKMTHSDNLVALVMLFVATVTFVVSEGYMLNFIAVLVFNGCLFSFITINDAPYFMFLLTGFLAVVYTSLHLQEASWIAKSRKFNVLYNPVRTGFLLSVIAYLVALTTNWLFDGHSSFPMLSSVILILSCMFVVYKAIKYTGIRSKINRFMIYALVVLPLLPTLFYPAIAGAVLVILICFYTGHRNSAVLGVLALAYVLIMYYYNLEYTLLVKSIILFVSGLLFLLIWTVFKKQVKAV